MSRYKSIVSGFESTTPVLVMQQGGTLTRHTLAFKTSPTHHGTSLPLDCLALLSTADTTAYTTWAASGGSVSVHYQVFGLPSVMTLQNTVTAIDAASGTFSFLPDATMVSVGGILNIQAILKNKNSVAVASTECYGFVQPTLTSADAVKGTAKYFSIRDVRSFLSDTDPTENSVLQTLEFSDENVVESIIYAISTAVAIPPRLAAIRPTTIPAMMVLPMLQLAASFLMDKAARHSVRNDLRIEGTSGVNFAARAQGYAALASNLKREATEAITRIKQTCNQANGFGSYIPRSYGL